MIANINYLWVLLPVCIIAVILILRIYYWQKKVVLTLVSPKFSNKFLLNFSLTRKKVSLILFVCAIIFLSASILRPQAKLREEKVSQEGRDLLIALDISRSMLASDVQPDRLKMAKDKIKKLVLNLDADRVGLILFSGSAYQFVPFTNDVDAFMNFLDDVAIEQYSSGTTAIDKAIAKAIEIFGAPNAKKNKLLVLFTDGEDFSANLSHVIDESKKLGLNIFLVGVGTSSGAPIPIYDENNKIKEYQKDKSNNVVITKLNEELLQQLAQNLSANYLKAIGESDEDILKLSNAIKKIEKEKTGEGTFKVAQEVYYIPAIISFILLFILWLI